LVDLFEMQIFPSTQYALTRLSGHPLSFSHIRN